VYLNSELVTIREGTRALDSELLDMAKCYRFSKAKTLRHVIWPQLHPFVMAATRSGLALIWKIASYQKNSLIAYIAPRLCPLHNRAAWRY
jgi:ABC-type anion transport system duplicated permease subunit